MHGGEQRIGPDSRLMISTQLESSSLKLPTARRNFLSLRTCAPIDRARIHALPEIALAGKRGQLTLHPMAYTGCGLLYVCISACFSLLPIVVAIATNLSGL